MKEQYPHCPYCGAECETVYRNIKTGLYIGCDVCAEAKDAWETPDCFPEDE